MQVKKFREYARARNKIVAHCSLETNVAYIASKRNTSCERRAEITELEWKTLWLKKHREKINEGLMEAKPLIDCFIGRKGDGHPCMITVWRGWQRIIDGAEIYEIIAPQ